jgi:hypothetical protein
MTRRLAAIAAAGAAACIVPPSQSSLGAIATARGPGSRASVGAHSAAVDHHGTAPIDLGAGYIAEDDPDLGVAHGTYVALARRVHRTLWVGGRVELFWNVEPGQPRRGLVARAALRRHLGGVKWGTGDGGGGFGVLGALAAGAYLDLGARQLDGGGGDLFGAAGVSLDLPAFAGMSR